MTTNKIPNGTLVRVRHDGGTELGMVVGAMHPHPGEIQMYTIEFLDRTRSTWPAYRVTVDPSEVEARRLAATEIDPEAAFGRKEN